MKAFTKHTGLVGPLDRTNIDTDIIIPKQYLKSISRSGFGAYLFDGIRFLDEGWPGKPMDARSPNPDFVLNQPRYEGASVLLTRKNFGCGSSREHAPWALEDYGFRAIIAPSFADIFYNNCFKNGVLPIALDESIVDRLFQATVANEGYSLTIDLENQRVVTPDDEHFSFEVDEFRRHCLLNGLDEIGLSLESADAIRAFEAQQRQAKPWLYDVISPEKI